MTVLIVGGILLYLIGIGITARIIRWKEGRTGYATEVDEMVMLSMWWPVAVMLIVVVGCVYGVPYIIGYTIAWLSGALEDRVLTTGTEKAHPCGGF